MKQRLHSVIQEIFSIQFELCSKLYLHNNQLETTFDRQQVQTVWVGLY